MRHFALGAHRVSALAAAPALVRVGACSGSPAAWQRAYLGRQWITGAVDDAGKLQRENLGFRQGAGPRYGSTAAPAQLTSSSRPDPRPPFPDLEEDPPV